MGRITLVAYFVLIPIVTACISHVLFIEILTLGEDSEFIENLKEDKYSFVVILGTLFMANFLRLSLNALLFLSLDIYNAIQAVAIQQ